MPFLILAPYFLPQKVFAYYAYSEYGVIRRELCTENLIKIISPAFAYAYAMLLLLVLYFIPVMVLCFTCGSIALRLLGVTDEQTIIKSSLRKEEAGRRKVTTPKQILEAIDHLPMAYFNLQNPRSDSSCLCLFACLLVCCLFFVYVCLLRLIMPL